MSTVLQVIGGGVCIAAVWLTCFIVAARVIVARRHLREAAHADQATAVTRPLPAACRSRLADLRADARLREIDEQLDATYRYIKDLYLT